MGWTSKAASSLLCAPVKQNAPHDEGKFDRLSTFSLREKTRVFILRSRAEAKAQCIVNNL
jgi:hypothetical protein